jgi:hypothetical protein
MMKYVYVKLGRCGEIFEKFRHTPGNLPPTSIPGNCCLSDVRSSFDSFRY